VNGLSWVQRASRSYERTWDTVAGVAVSGSEVVEVDQLTEVSDVDVGLCVVELVSGSACEQVTGLRLIAGPMGGPVEEIARELRPEHTEVVPGARAARRGCNMNAVMLTVRG
jgi:hypothetical protein